MHFSNVDREVGVNRLQAMLTKAKEFVGKIITVKESKGGNVSYVYKVVGEKDTVFIKLRGNHFSRIPNIETNPKAILYEKKALKIFSKQLNNIFPKILYFDAKNFGLILSNVFPTESSFEDKLNNQTDTLRDYEVLGKTLARVHITTKHFKNGIREDNDLEFRNKALMYCLENYKHKKLVYTAKEFKKRPGNLILGDPSPKNMSIDKEIIGICDLDNVHLSSHLYDLAYVAAHCLLHNLENIDKAELIVNTVISNYLQYNQTLEFNTRFFIPTLTGVMLYRLKNEVVPYDLAIDEKRKFNYFDTLFKSLDKELLTVHKLIGFVRKNAN